jgi:hypothetical protein
MPVSYLYYKWIQDCQTFVLKVNTWLANSYTPCEYLYYIIVFVLLSGYMTVKYLCYMWIYDLNAFNSVQFTMYYTFFFNVDAVVCQNNGQFQIWELNIWQFIVIVEIKYFLNLKVYDFPIFILVKLCFDNIMSIIMKVSYMKSNNI